MPHKVNFPKFAMNLLLLLYSLNHFQINLRMVLQTLNLHCEEAENGKVAVDYFKQGRIYDLVFMDKEMPVMDGHEVDKLSSF